MRLLLIAFKNSHGAIRLQEEAGKPGIDLVLHDPNERADTFTKINPADFDVLYVRHFYTQEKAIPEILDLAKRFAAAGKRVIDAILAEGDYATSNKYDNGKILESAGLPVPRSYRLDQVDKLEYPIVIKWQYGFGGKHIYYIEKLEQIPAVIKQFPKEELFAQEYISARYEYKVMCIGYKALPYILQYAIDPHTRVSDLSKVKIIAKDELPYLTNIAELASKLLGREISKVDVLETEKGLVILEVNRCPGGKVYEEVMGENYFGVVCNYIVK